MSHINFICEIAHAYQHMPAYFHYITQNHAYLPTHTRTWVPMMAQWPPLMRGHPFWEATFTQHLGWLLVRGFTVCDDESDEGLSELHYVMMNLMRAFQNYIMWWWISWWPFRIMLCDDESHESLSELQLCDDEFHESLSELHYVMMNLMGAFQNYNYVMMNLMGAFQNYNYVMMNLMRAYPNKTCHGSRAANLWKLTSVTICNNFNIFSNISQNFSIFMQ